MLGWQYKLMDRFYVMIGDTFQGIVREPVFLETTEDGKPLGRPARLDGWYLGIPTGRRWQVPAVRPGMRLLAGLVLFLGQILLSGWRSNL